MRLLMGLLAVSVVLMVSASFSFAGPAPGSVKLLQTGQVNTDAEKAMTDSATNTILLYPPHDDGDLQMGLKWTASTRFRVNGDGTITDNMTGLMWMRDGNLPLTAGYTKATGAGTVYWANALDFINLLNFGAYAAYNAGYQDWRLPNIIELESLTTADRSCSSMLAIGGFRKENSTPSVVTGLYASSMTFAGNPEGTFIINMNCGKIMMATKHEGLYVLPVRGHTGGTALVRRTGQTNTYAANDDGALQEGAVWPAPRFVLNADNTVTDRLTGLSWAQNAGTPAFGSFTAGIKTWPDAIAYVDALNAGNYLGHNDWRLPNRRELGSLVDFSHFAPALPPDHIFINIRFSNKSSISARSPNFYWTSTSHYSHRDSAFYLDIYSGEMPFAKKVAVTDPADPARLIPPSKYYVWPVRGGTAVNPPAPASRITYPADGAYMPAPLGTYNITGTAGGGSGGITGVSVSADGGTTWKAATDTSSDGSWATWKYSWTPPSPGQYNIRSKAVDGDSNEETPGSGVNVYAGVYRLDLNVSPTGGGTVTPDPTGGSYNEGTRVTLTAAPAPKYIFTGWSGSLSGTENPAAMTMDGDKSVTANFDSPDYTLTVNVTPQGGGTVQASPSGTLKPGDVVSLAAVPAEGWLFNGWEGSVADKTSASTTITVNGNEAVTAKFRKETGITLVMAQNGRKILLIATGFGENPTGKVRFFISGDGGNTWAAAGERVAAGTDGTFRKRLRLVPGSYKLKARSRFSDGQIYESPIVDCPIVRVQALAPAPKAVAGEPEPVVSWAAVPGATGYQVTTRTFFTNAKLGTVTVPGGQTSAALPPLIKGKKTTWSVTALFPTGRSLPSAPRAVTYKEATSLTGLDAGLSGKRTAPSVILAGDGGRPLAGKPVRFRLRDASGTWALFGFAVTDASGKAQLAPKALKVKGSYGLKAVFPGNARLSRSGSGEVTFEIE